MSDPRPAQLDRTASATAVKTSERNAGVWRLVGELLTTVPGGWWRFGLAALLGTAATASSVALMAVAAWLLSRAAQHPPVLYLEAAAVLVRAFGISRGGLRYLERLVGHDLALRMQGALRVRTYDTLSRTTLLGRRRGDLLVRLVSDVDAVLDVVVRVALPAISAGVVMIVTSIVMATISVPAGVVLLITTVVAGVLVPLGTRALSARVDASIAPLRGVLGTTIYQVSHAAVDLAAYGAADQQLAELSRVDAQLRRAEQRATWIRGLGQAAQVVAAGVAVIAALVFGAHGVVNGVVAPVMLAVLVLTPLAMHESLADLTKAAQTMTRARSSLGRVLAVLEQPPVGSGDLAPSVPGEVAGVEMAGASIGWPGQPPLLDGVNLAVAPGQRVAVVGPSGIGKTTLAATIMGLIDPRAGSVRTQGRVRYLAQDAHLFTTTVAENIRIGDPHADEAALQAALAASGLDLPLNRMVGEGGRALSGGEARRLALARVLVGSQPEDAHDLLILDEPTEHLDAETAEHLMADLWTATRSAAVLVITHDPEVMAACDHIVRLDPAPSLPT